MGRQDDGGFTVGDYKQEERLISRLVRSSSLGRVSDLTELTRGILGLSEVGITDVTLMARCLVQARPRDSEAEAESRVRQLAREIRSILNALRKTTHPVVLHVWNFGVPAECSVEINSVGVRCLDCGAVLTRVPCVACCDLSRGDVGILEKQKSGVELGQVLHDPPLMDPSEPTDAYPGSPEKIEVMRLRIEAGYGPFHAADRVTDDFVRLAG